MATSVSAILALTAVVVSTLAVAEVKATRPHPPPSSYAPQAHSDRHVYGSPLEPPIVGHARPSHRAHGAKKQAGGTLAPHGHAAPVRRAAPKPRRPAPDSVPAAPRQSN